MIIYRLSITFPPNSGTRLPSCPDACCTLPSISTTINVCRTEASNQGGMAIYQHNVLDCLNTILIGGGGCQDLGDFFVIHACVRQNAHGTNRLLSFLSGDNTPAASTPPTSTNYALLCLYSTTQYYHSAHDSRRHSFTSFSSTRRLWRFLINLHRAYMSKIAEMTWRTRYRYPMPLLL